MDLPALKQSTDAAVHLSHQLGMDGGIVVLVVIKERFSVTPEGRIKRRGDAEVRLIDEPWNPEDPENSSIKLPTDICLRKPGTDVLVVGSAMAPQRMRAAELDVYVQVGALEKQLKVHGPRVWVKKLGGLGMSRAEPTEATPLQWELAYGGRDFSDPKRPLEESRNPAGLGVTHDPDKLALKPAPRIEHFDQPIKDQATRTVPAGVGALCRHWSPRREYTGTMDETWQRERMPLLPFDFDDRHNQFAPTDMIVQGYLRGGEQVSLLNLNIDGAMRFALPSISFYVGAHREGHMRQHPPVLDTLLLMPNERTFELTWRSAVPVPRPAHALEAIQVHEKVRLS